MPPPWRIFLNPSYQSLKNLAYRLVYSCIRVIRPVCQDSVILATNRTQTLTDNLRFIFDRIDQEKYHVTTFFLSRPSTSWTSRLLAQLRFVAKMATTQYTIVDDFLPPVYALRLRPGVRLVQVWHALGALKRVGYSRGGKNGGPGATSISHKNYTDVIVSATSIRKNFAEAFAVSIDKVHATGAPRSDLFFNPREQESARASIHAAYPLLKGKRVILFAPTFRGERKRTAHYPSAYLDLDRMHAELGDEDILVLRMHPFVKDRVPIPPACRDKIIDLSDYPEFNHILLLCELLVTDYSSAIFDYSLLKRPVVFYAPDLDMYTRDRGFYYDFSEYAYGPVVRDLDSLLPLLGTTTVYEERRTRFCKRFLDACDGHATERFLATILADSQGFPHAR